MTLKIYSSVAAAVCLFAGPASAQDTANIIPFQGQLANQSGQPLSPTGPSTLVFRLYRQAVGGIAIWEESQPNISVSAGRFSVLLGSRTELPSAPNFNTTLYLGITMDDGNPTTADVEMRPRQALVPVISARYAQDADKLRGYDWSALFGTNNPAEGTLLDSKIQDGSLGANKLADLSISNAKLDSGAVTAEKINQSLCSGLLVPVGGVIMWWGSVANIPNNFELCDGTTPTTPGATFTDSKPDLRDRFPKGALAGAADVKASPVTGGNHTVAQRNTGGTAITVAQMPSHTHSTVRDYVNPVTQGGGIWSGGGTDGGTGIANGTTATGGGQPHDHTLSAHDNRPAFLEMFFIIRVK